MIASPAAAQDVIERTSLSGGWEMASSTVPLDAGRIGALPFRPAAGAISTGSDDEEHWFRCRFDAPPAGLGEEVVLRFGGIATLSEAWLNGRPILRSDSMFASHDVPVSALLEGSGNELLIACRSVSAALRAKGSSLPRARWRTRVVSRQQLRWFRTSLLGRAPGFAPGPPPVGPWRPIVLERRRHIVVNEWTRQVEVDGSTGIIRTGFTLRPLRQGAAPVACRLHSKESSAPLPSKGDRAEGVLRIPGVRRWWPHTHGEPFLYPLRLELRLEDGSEVWLDDLPVGFRSVESAAEFGLKVNGAEIFSRGVVWTPCDGDAVQQRLRLLAEGGFNLIRVPGTGAYEFEDFHSLCDRLGLLVWQDLMFANMDYPFEDASFLQTVRSEAADQLARIGRHPSTAVICGNSEIEQQVGMLGLDSALGRSSFFREDLPGIAARACPGVPYVPSAPCGGDQPFRTRSGVANYFGIGAYLRPIEDVRRSEVRFASECLAFANVPEPELIAQMSLAVPGGISPTHPRWKEAVPRDGGAGWDFEDVRDHYLQQLYRVNPVTLRSTDTNHYWELSRLVSGELMAEVFGEWRRAQSCCRGGIVLWSADLKPGAGWGILDSNGDPKAAYWFLKRALAPRAIWTTDEGLNGVDVHIANDRPDPLHAWLRVALFARGEEKVAEAGREIAIEPRQSRTEGVEQILGRFVDASYAYRFGPPRHDLIVVSLHHSPEEAAFAQAFRFPVERPTDRLPITELGLEAEARQREDGGLDVWLKSRRFAWGVRVAAQGALPDDCYFGVEPGGLRTIVLSPLRPGVRCGPATASALNAEGRIAVIAEPPR